LSNAFLEAMAAGRGIVATAVGGNPELVLDGITGKLVPPRNPHALADAVMWLLDSPEACAAFGAAGRRRIEECFDMERMTRGYERLYSSMLMPPGAIHESEECQLP
jgi:glycosyltransferase involved in cell wall biosynthesis